MRRLKYVVAAVAMAALLVGCAGTTGGKDEDPQSGSNAPSEAEEAVTEEEAPKSENLTFGETYTYEDGLSVTIGAPSEFQPGEWAAMMQEWPAYVQFDVTVVNGTSENFDPNMIHMTMQSGNVEGEQVFDGENGFNGPPTTTLLTGREAVFKVGFGVNDPADLVLEVSPDLGIEWAPFIVTN